MKIVILTMWYNEEFLAPLFLSHYTWADKIVVVLDMDTTDRTEDIICELPGVAVIPFRFTAGFDDAEKIAKINEVANTLDCDWVIAVDADEFITPGVLNSCYDVVIAKMFQVYKHKTEGPINRSLPPMLQRCYGDPNTSHGINSMYRKPCIVRRAAGTIKWTPGCHTVNFKKVSPHDWTGAHWAMADEDLAVERRIRGRRDRISNSARAAGLSSHNHNVTENDIRQACRNWEEAGVKVL